MSRRLWAPAAALAAGAAVALLGAAQAGGEAALGAAVGTVLVLAFLGGGVLPLLLPVAGGAGPGCLVLATTYLLRLLAAGVALAVALRSGAVDRDWTAYALIAAALAWTLGQGAAVLGPGGPQLPPGLRPVPWDDDEDDEDDQPGHGPPARGL